MMNRIILPENPTRPGCPRNPIAPGTPGCKEKSVEIMYSDRKKNV